MTSTDLRRGQALPDAHSICAAAEQTTGDQPSPDAHSGVVAGPHSPADHPVRGAQKAAVGGELSSSSDQLGRDIHNGLVAVSWPAPAMEHPAPKGTALAPADLDPPAPATTTAAPNTNPPGPAVQPWLADPLLQLAADVLDDLEKVRVANQNRLRQLTRDEADSDGLERGFGLDVSHPDVARLAALVDDLGRAEHQAELNLRRLLRQHPLGPWMRAAQGVGEKQGARLLAALGDPYVNTLHGRPRTVSELWAYSGFHTVPAGHPPVDTHTDNAGGDTSGGSPDQIAGDTQRSNNRVAAARARGQRANWSATAKMRAHLVAVSCMKTAGPYRDVYEQTRAKYADATHPVPCRRCGPAGQPAPAGSALSAGHQHARALRLVAKRVLRDLWLEARRLHENGPDQ